MRQDTLGHALHCGDFNIWVPSLGLVPVDEQFNIGPHSHYYFELHYIDDGKGVNIVHHNRAEVALEAGTFYLAKPGEVHEQHSMRAQPLRIFFIGFNISACSEGHPAAAELNSRLELAAQSQQHAYFLKPLVQAILSETQRRAYGYELAVKGLMLQLITLLIRTAGDSLPSAAPIPWATHPLPARTYPSPEHERAVRESVRYCHQNIHRKVDVSEVARLHHWSASHFRRLFKEATGMAFGEYMRQYKASLAQQLLQADTTVKDIASQLGYGSPEQFSKAFKLATGYSPAKFKSAPKND